ncbi:MAG: hypothetical protein QOE46_1615 [Acidobacteriota bacterium]|jgi:protein-tyrosine-phosphatase|nr:hypothetical protein [Acidobacteriota bacterium]
MLVKKRTFSFGIWGLGLGYYLFYAPYSGLTKALSAGLLPSTNGRPVSGAALLPATTLATAICILGFITVMRWWRYAGRREFFGLSVPFPRHQTFLSGVCMATIIGTTTLAFSFKGISIVLMLVLLRSGVLVLAPLVDAMLGRRVRWFSWAAMCVSLAAVLVVLNDASNFKLGLAAVLDVAAYLTAYFFKFQFMTRLGKSEEREATLRYFVEEQMVAAPLLLLTLGLLAVVGAGETMLDFRRGFIALVGSGAIGPALLIGLCYAGLCVCTTFIFLDRRENTFCVPMHCGTSMLAGVTASYALTFLAAQPPPSGTQLVSAGLLTVALALLSPLHHFRLYLDRLKHSLTVRLRTPRDVVIPFARTESPTLGDFEIAPPGDPHPWGGHQASNKRRVFLFVCSGNTCRSPMAAAIGNAELAARLYLRATTPGEAGVHALSAGISARVGTPMIPEAQQALRMLDIPVIAHSARNLSPEDVQQVERIFCMTREHRNAVIELEPAAAAKTHCLDPAGDVEDPFGRGPAAYVDCARRIRSLVRLRFDELALTGGLHG